MADIIAPASQFDSINKLSAIIVSEASLSNVISAQSNKISTLSDRFSTLRGGAAGFVLKKNTATDFDWSWLATGGGGTSATVTSQEVSTLSNAISVISQGLSVVSNALSNEISNRTSADNALSNAVSIVSNALSNEISNRTSAINVVSNAASNALSVANAASAAGAALSLVVSTMSTTISNLTSVVSTISTTLSNLGSVVTVAMSQTISVISNAVSVLQAGFGTINPVVQQRSFNTLQSITASVFTNVSGISVSIVAGGVYSWMGQVMFVMSAAAATSIGFGFTFPAGAGIVAGAAEMNCMVSVIGGASLTSANYAAGNTQAAGFSTVASNMISISAIGAITTLLNFDGTIIMSAGQGGTIQLQYHGGATPVTVNFRAGFIRAFRIG